MSRRLRLSLIVLCLAAASACAAAADEASRGLDWLRGGVGMGHVARARWLSLVGGAAAAAASFLLMVAGGPRKPRGGVE